MLAGLITGGGKRDGAGKGTEIISLDKFEFEEGRGMISVPLVPLKPMPFSNVPVNFRQVA
jgi:hypothetical protein